VSRVREQLAFLYEKDQQWLKAAQTLMAIPLDSGHRVVSDEYKLTTYLHIVTWLIQGGDEKQAETYLNRAGYLLLPHHSFDLQRMYKESQAHLFMVNEKYMEAAFKYLEVFSRYALELNEPCSRPLPLTSSTSSLDFEKEKSTWIDPKGFHWYTLAMQCAVLGMAGPTKETLFATLLMDSGSTTTTTTSSSSSSWNASWPSPLLLPNPPPLSTSTPSPLKNMGRYLAHVAHVQPALHQVFKRMHAHQFIRVEDIPEYLKAFHGHPGGTVNDEGLTPFHRSVWYHNIVCVSEVYTSISLRSLSEWLQLPEHTTEPLVSTLILDQRIHASLDGVHGFIDFQRVPASSSSSTTTTTLPPPLHEVPPPSPFSTSSSSFTHPNVHAPPPPPPPSSSSSSSSSSLPGVVKKVVATASARPSQPPPFSTLLPPPRGSLNKEHQGTPTTHLHSRITRLGHFLDQVTLWIP
ncbi:hypothetical protein HMI56_001956, partial [Coelomomyces lativittatus]